MADLGWLLPVGCWRFTKATLENQRTLLVLPKAAVPKGPWRKGCMSVIPGGFQWGCLSLQSLTLDNSLDSLESSSLPTLPMGASSKS